MTILDDPVSRITKYTPIELLLLFNIFRITRPNELREVISNSLKDIFTCHGLYHLTTDENKEKINEITVNMHKEVLTKYDAGNIYIYI